MVVYYIAVFILHTRLCVREKKWLNELKMRKKKPERWKKINEITSKGELKSK